MGETDIKKLMDFFGGELEDNEDSEQIDFNEPVRGKYICKIEYLFRDTGEWPSGDPKDMWRLRFQAVKDVEGDKSYNRYFEKKYYLTEGSTEYPKDPENERRKLFKDIKSARLKFELPDNISDKDEALGIISPQIEGQLINVSAYPMDKTNGTGQTQVTRIVKELKVKKKNNW